MSWAKHRPVYKHVAKDRWKHFKLWSEGISHFAKLNLSNSRFIFWNAGGLGWCIGKEAYLTRFWQKMVQIIFEFWIIHDHDDFVSSAAIWDYFATVSLTGKWMIMLPMKVVIVVDTSVAVEATGIVVTWTQLNPGKGLGREGWVFASSGLVVTTRAWPLSPLSPLHLYRYLDNLNI